MNIAFVAVSIRNSVKFIATKGTFLLLSIMNAFYVSCQVVFQAEGLVASVALKPLFITMRKIHMSSQHTSGA